MNEKVTGSPGRIADSLRAEILAGTFTPGERIRQEVLADRYGASRLPVRDALRTLEAEGMSIPGLAKPELDRLLPLVEAIQAAEPVEEFLALDREFHMLTYSAARTTMLGELVERLWNNTQHYRRAFTLLGTDRTARGIHLEHELLALAILRGDTDAAERALLGHIRTTRKELSAHPEVFHASSVVG